MVERRKLTVRSDRHVMPWLIPAVKHGPSKDCVLVASMEGNEMLTISLHVADAPASEEQESS